VCCVSNSLTTSNFCWHQHWECISLHAQFRYVQKCARRQFQLHRLLIYRTCFRLDTELSASLKQATYLLSSPTNVVNCVHYISWDIRGCQSSMKNYLTSTFFAEIRSRLITSGLVNQSSPTLTTPKCIIISKSYLCYKQMNPPHKCRATSLDKIIWTKNCNSKCAFYAYLSTFNSTRVHLSKSRNLYLARQVVRHQGPTEPKHSQHSAF